MKMNALEDADISRALYRAAQSGVKIDLIVRDTCRLRPGVPGLSESVRVISIVGRFLEHGRIFYFQNGGHPEYYIGSADCMKRNLESRVEVMVPIEDPRLQEELRSVLDLQLADRDDAWEMDANGTYVKLRGGGGPNGGSQEAIIERADKRLRQASRLRRRRPKGIGRRQVH
jgi:polyphosphate kinase